MGDEFYAVIKLVSGEEIVSLIMIDENDGDPVVVLQNPITIKMIENSNAVYVKIKPWIENSSEDFFIVKLDKIITMTETIDEKMIEIYNNYIMNGDDRVQDKMSGKVKPSERMGYISSVEDARNSLEKIFNNTNN
jgi:hypothetical protein